MDDLDTEIAQEIGELCLREESVPVFVEAMKEIPQHNKSLVGRILVGLCAKTFLGRKYRIFAEALLTGETGHVVDVNFRSPGGASALHLAAKNHDFELICFLLSRGARTDLRGLRPRKRYRCEDGYDIDCEGKIPLELAFYLSSPFRRLKPGYWTSNSGGLFGIFMVHVATEFVRKSFELLTKATEKIGRVVNRCVKEVRPDVLGLLLLADRDKVFSSNMLEENDGFASEQRTMAVREAIMAELARAEEDRSSVSGSARSSLLYRKLESKEHKLIFSLTLLEVFDKAGDALNADLLSKSGKVVVEEVASLLKECGCNLSYDNTIYGGSSLDDLEAARETLDEASDLVEFDLLQYSYMNFQDAMRCSILYSPETEDKYHSECFLEYDRFISDAIIARDAEKHIRHHADFATGQAKSTFIKFVKSIPAHKTTLVNSILVYVLGCAFESRKEHNYPIYKSCISSLLNGETGHHVDVNFLWSFGVTALHVAAHHLNTEAVEMLLQHGATADIRAEKPYDDVYNILHFRLDDQTTGKLPLELALPLRFNCDGEPASWSSHGGKVLAGFFESFGQKDDYIELIRLLVSHTKGIRQVVVNCINGAEVLGLGVLLLAAYERVMSLPMGKGIGPSEGCMKISDYTMMEIVKVTEGSLKEKEEGGDRSRLNELEIKKNRLMFMLYMLEVIGEAQQRGKVAFKELSRFVKSKGFSSKRCMRNAKTKLQKFRDSNFQSQAAAGEGKRTVAARTGKTEDVLPGHTPEFGSEYVKPLTSNLSELEVSKNPARISHVSEEASDEDVRRQDVGRRIKALKKKIRVAKAQQPKKTAQKDKLMKLESWSEELKLLQDKKAEMASS